MAVVKIIQEIQLNLIKNSHILHVSGQIFQRLKIKSAELFVSTTHFLHTSCMRIPLFSRKIQRWT